METAAAAVIVATAGSRRALTSQFQNLFQQDKKKKMERVGKDDNRIFLLTNEDQMVLAVGLLLDEQTILTNQKHPLADCRKDKKLTFQ